MDPKPFYGDVVIQDQERDLSPEYERGNSGSSRKIMNQRKADELL